MFKAERIGVRYESSSTIEHQGNRQSIDRYLRQGYSIKVRRNGYWVLTKPAQVIVTAYCGENGSFTYDIATLQIKITFISGEKRTYNYNSWPEFNSIKNSIDEMIDKHMFEAEENRKALEEEQKIQEMLETLQKVYRVGEDSTANDILNGRGLKPLGKNGKLVLED